MSDWDSNREEIFKVIMDILNIVLMYCRLRGKICENQP